MQVNKRNIGAIREGINSAFFIKQNSEDEYLKKECQRFIDVLFKKFPDEVPLPTKLLSNYGDS